MNTNEPPIPSAGSEEIESLRQQKAYAETEYLDWERWAKEVNADFRILYDNHKVGMRIAITQWMADKNQELTTLKSNLDEARRDKERLLSLVPSEAELQAGRDAVSPALNRLVNAGFKATSPQFALDVSAIVDHITFMNNALASMSPTSTT